VYQGHSNAIRAERRFQGILRCVACMTGFGGGYTCCKDQKAEDHREGRVKASKAENGERTLAKYSVAWKLRKSGKGKQHTESKETARCEDPEKAAQ
tara:strand:+ start:7156 stop:7443 length:288 start_codon:yes stop_codon:yes gene_type:complete